MKEKRKKEFSLISSIFCISGYKSFFIFLLLPLIFLRLYFTLIFTFTYIVHCIFSGEKIYLENVFTFLDRFILGEEEIYNNGT